MHKALIIISLFAFCAANAAAVADAYEHVLGNSGTALTDHQGEPHSTDADDHCCHLAGHLLGIMIAHTHPIASTQSVQTARMSIDGYGRATAPPVPPPNI
jgi:hypothetical protein